MVRSKIVSRFLDKSKKKSKRSQIVTYTPDSIGGTCIRCGGLPTSLGTVPCELDLSPLVSGPTSQGRFEREDEIIITLESIIEVPLHHSESFPSFRQYLWTESSIVFLLSRLVSTDVTSNCSLVLFHWYVYTIPFFFFFVSYFFYLLGTNSSFRWVLRSFIIQTRY